jgi:hypothetical protein
VSAALTDPAARRKKPPAGCLIPLLAIFLVAGAAVVYVLCVRPILKTVAARRWPEVPCVILSSEVGRHSGSKGGTTYSIDIRYRYEREGSPFEGKDYDFLGGSSSGYDGKADVVAKYPPGSTRVCYVNPRDASEAVLDREFRFTYLLGLFGLIFMGVGGGGIYLFFRPPRLRAKGAAPKGMTQVYSRVPAVGSGSVTLKPVSSPGCRLAIALAVCLFWNGIVSIFLFSGMDGCAALFMIPFVLVGLGLVGWVGYQVLALFNPVPILTVSAAAAPLGGTFELEWRFEGNVARLRTLRITLEGREEATYRRGTRTTTDKSVFATILVHGDAVLAAGRATVQVPRGTMHSFSASNNKIVWTLHVRGEIRRWPDVGEEFPFTVLPL